MTCSSRSAYSSSSSVALNASTSWWGSLRIKPTGRVRIHLPYDKGGLLDMLYREARVEAVEYSETIDVTAVCPPRVLGQIAAYTTDWAPPKEDWE